MTPPEGGWTVGQLIQRLVDLGDMEMPVLLSGKGWLCNAYDDMGEMAVLCVKRED